MNQARLGDLRELTGRRDVPSSSVRALTVSLPRFSKNVSVPATSGETYMTTKSTQIAFDADREDRLAAATVTVLVFTGGILSLLLLGSFAVNAIT
jgi:hypothetical protein